MEQNQGTVRSQVAEFVIIDPKVKDVIKMALKANGYDIELKPIIQQNSHFYIGDEFKVFKKEQY